MSDDPALVVQYLAANDAPCPSCGYSLKGCTQPCCPECGDQVLLTLRGESSTLLVTALRYMFLALGTRSILMSLWALGASIYYSFGAMGSLGFAWYTRIGFDAIIEIVIGVLCFVGLRRLKLSKPQGTFRGTVKLVAWIAILEVSRVILGVLISFAY